jgi:hypothetical protein
LFDFQYGENGLQQEAGESLYGASADMKRTTSSFDQGLYGAGEFAYSATSSITAIATIATDNVMDNTNKVSSASATYGGILNFDTEFSASYAGLFGSDTVGAQQEVFTLQVSQSMFDDADFESIRAWKLMSGSGKTHEINTGAAKGAAAATGAVTKAALFPQFTRLNPSNIDCET